MVQKAHVPSDAGRKKVKAMAAYGIREADIAAWLEISDKTLRKYYASELATGHVEANAKVAETLFRMATSGNCPAATIFWTKVRNGWQEVARPQHHVVEERRSLESMTPVEQRQRALAFLQKYASPPDELEEDQVH